MTRELKLALIVGFALVLVVTVLISDHLSRARQARLADAPREVTPVAAGGISSQPTSMARDRATTPAGPLVEATPAPAMSDPVADIAARPYPTTGPVALSTPTAPQTGAAPPDQPRVLVQGQPPATPSLADAAKQIGMEIVNGEIREIRPALKKEQLSVGDARAQPGVLTQQPTAPSPTITEPAPNGPNTVAPGPLADPKPQPPAPMPIGTSSPAAPPAPIPRGTPASTPDQMYTIVAGDSLYRIAKRTYGDGDQWRRIADANSLSAESSLAVGAKLRIPPALAKAPKVASRTAPAKPADLKPVAADTRVALAKPAPGRNAQPRVDAAKPAVKPEPELRSEPKRDAKQNDKTYVVAKGDTLMSIAQRTLGTVRRTDDIIALNEGVADDPDNIPIGTVLKLPAR